MGRSLKYIRLLANRSDDIVRSPSLGLASQPFQAGSTFPGAPRSEEVDRFKCSHAWKGRRGGDGGLSGGGLVPSSGGAELEDRGDGGESMGRAERRWGGQL